ncbi:hypothetical protein ES708_23382 [subsurface metagenome]
MDNSKSNQKLEIGDVVMLKSGGPKMTISNFEKTGSIYCVWFIGNLDKLYHDYFLPGTLEKQ